MQALGTVTLVQIQTRPLKRGEAPQRVYQTDDLLRVEELRLTKEGVIGVDATHTNILDAHHALHTQSRFRNNNGISIGFATHYAALREKFGDHLYDGSAGENIIIAGDTLPFVDDLGTRVALHNPRTGSYIYLNVVGIIAPCEPFARFCTQTPNLSGNAMKETLQFLAEGRRGYLFELARQANTPPIVQAGDEFVVVEQ